MKEEKEDHTFQTGSYNIELKINSPLFFASGQPTPAQLNPSLPFHEPRTVMVKGLVEPVCQGLAMFR